MKKIIVLVAVLVMGVTGALGEAISGYDVWEGEDGNITLVAHKDGYKVAVSYKDGLYMFSVYETGTGYVYECGCYEETIYSIVLDGRVWYMPYFEVMEEVAEEL